MPDPLTLLALGSTAVGTVGSFLGSRDKIHPEIARLMKMFEEQYLRPRGIAPRTLELMKGQTKASIGSEAGALQSITGSRIARQGGGAAATNVAINRINRDRLISIGQALADIDIGNEQVKLQQSNQALQGLLGVMPNIPYEQTGAGYGQLAGAGLNYLLNQPDFSGIFGNEGSNLSTLPTLPVIPYIGDMFEPQSSFLSQFGGARGMKGRLGSGGLVDPYGRTI